MNAPLRLTIYDKTDITSDLLGLDVPIGLTHSWFAGGRLYRMMRWVDETRGFATWEDALDWLAHTEPDQKIKQIQVWGHGGPGRSYMAGEALSHDSVYQGRHVLALQLIADRMTRDGVIWFRQCSVFAGPNGHRFARTGANEMGCRVAGHTHIIGPWQSGLHTIEPNENPRWPTGEGLVDGKPVWGRPWTANTVNMLRSDIPDGW